MPATPWPDASQSRLALQQGRLDCPTLLQQCHLRYQQHQAGLNALVSSRWSGAAAEATRLATLPAPRADALPLLGVPVSIKDCWATRDLPTTASYPPLAGWQPARDASVVARLRAAGAIIVGKSNLPALAALPTCHSPLFGATHNPWQTGVTPGGSSGGSAAAVACGISLLEIGSDIGGSVRIPAAYCGVIGFKPGEHRLPCSGHIPPLPSQLRTVRHMLSPGVLARSVADLMLAMPLLAGPDGEDLTTLHQPWQPAAPLERPLRLAWCEEFDGLPLCRRTTAGMAQASQQLRQAGHTLQQGWPHGFALPALWHDHALLLGAEAGHSAPAWQRRLLALASRLLPTSRALARGYTRGCGLSLYDYHALLARRDMAIIQLESLLQKVDVLICPVAAVAAYPVNRRGPQSPLAHIEVDGLPRPWLESAVGLTVPFSFTGHPVVSLPAAIIDGLPVGLQLVGRKGADESLLAVAAQVAQTLWPAGLPLPPACHG